MTVQSTTNRIDYTGDGVSVGPYNFTFPTVASWVNVYVGGLLVADSTYTLSVNANQESSPGGSVTFNVAVALDFSIVIIREAPVTQDTDYGAYDSFPSDRVEGDLDKSAVIDQQLKEQFNRVLKFPIDFTGDAQLPKEVPLGYFRWDSLGTSIEFVGIPGQVIPGTNVGVVSDMATDPSLLVGDFVFTTGYTLIGDDGDNSYEIVAAGTGTDDGGSYIDLAASGFQAKALFPKGLVSANQFGAVGDGVTDDSIAVQAAIDYVGSGKVSFPSESYQLSGINIDTDELVLDAEGSELINGSTGVDMFIFGATANVQQFKLKATKITSAIGAGHIFVLQELLAHAEFDITEVQQLETGKSIMFLDWDLALRPNAGVFFTNFNGEKWGITSSHTVAAFDIQAGSNRWSANNFNFNRCDRSGNVPFYYFDCTAGSQFFYHTTFNQQSGEVQKGGTGFFKGCAYFAVNEFDQFDVSTDGNPVNHMWECSTRTRNISFTNVHRQSGTLTAGKYDIKLNTGCTNTMLVNIGSHTTGLFDVDLDSQDVTIVNAPNVVFTNMDLGNVTFVDEDKIQTPKMSIPRKSDLTIASAAITVTGSNHRVDTEAAAATDNLNTINGGTDGMILRLQALSGARTIVVKDGTGNIDIGADASIDDLEKSIALVYDALSATWKRFGGL